MTIEPTFYRYIFKINGALNEWTEKSELARSSVEDFLNFLQTSAVQKPTREYLAQQARAIQMKAFVL